MSRWREAVKGWLIFALVGMGGGWALSASPGPPSLPLADGLRFEALEMSWEGGLRGGSGTLRGRVHGVEEPLTITYEGRRSGDDWIWRGEFELPLTEVTDFQTLVLLVPALQGWRGDGRISLRGSFSFEEEVWEADGMLGLSNVNLEQPELKFGLRGAYGKIAWRWQEGEIATRPGQVLTFSSAWWDEVQVGAGEIEWELVSAEKLRIDLAMVHWAGGRVSAGDFSFDPVAPEVSVRVYADGVHLGRLLEMVAELGATGEGVIDGDFGLRIQSDGIRLEPGQLALRPDHPARLRLPPRAWFTEGMPATQANYRNLRLVERALEDLNLTRFRLDFLPAAEDEPDLRLEIGGRSAASDLPEAPVSLTLNLHGPVQDLGNWFLGTRVRFGLR